MTTTKITPRNADRGPGHNHIVGKHGEHRAAKYLEDSGYTILERNWRCRDGEVDIVARSPEGIACMVEVKTRTNARFGHAVEAITPKKLARMRRVATQWRRERKWPAGIRVDVICIDLASGSQSPWHIEGADR